MNTKFITCLLGCSLLCSCNTMKDYYQICDVTTSLQKSAAGYTYTDANCEIKYNIWANGGNAGFTITNNTDEILYLDLGKSFFIRNGIANDYYQDRSTTSSVAASYGASSNATAIGLIGLYTIGSSSSAGIHNASSVTTQDCEWTLVPPHTSKIISRYTISPTPFTACEWDDTPKGKHPFSRNFNADNTPCNFSNYITYKIGVDGESHTVINEFYVTALRNLHPDDALQLLENTCNKERTNVKVLKDASPCRFFIKYQKESMPENSGRIPVDDLYIP